MTEARRKVLVVGGYGTFGGRLVKLLLDEPRLTLVVAGRSQESASRFCREVGRAAAQLVPARFDREGDLDAQLARIVPDIVVDATGPYQAYGDAPYRLVEAAIRYG
ncbi:MAG: saccharopine dehydrogenase NADP-binding domain-containing protein, partial [Parvibaculum sp.]